MIEKKRHKEKSHQSIKISGKSMEKYEIMIIIRTTV
jgi:hypothetical protein